MLFSEHIGFLDRTCLLVQPDGFFDQSFSLEVVRGSHCNLLRRCDAQTHDFSIQAIVNGNLHRLRMILRLGIEMDGLTQHTVLFHVPGQQETRLWLTLRVTDLNRLLKLILGQMQPY